MLLLDKDTIMKSGLMSSLIWQSLSGPHSGSPTRLTENYAMHLKQRQPTWIREAVCYAFCNEIYCHLMKNGVYMQASSLLEDDRDDVNIDSTTGTFLVWFYVSAFRM